MPLSSGDQETASNNTKQHDGERNEDDGTVRPS